MDKMIVKTGMACGKYVAKKAAALALGCIMYDVYKKLKLKLWTKLKRRRALTRRLNSLFFSFF